MKSMRPATWRHRAPAYAMPTDEPERHRQVQRRKRLGGAARGERIDVGEDTRRDEHHGQPAKNAGVETPLPGEIAGEERQHEEAHIADVEGGVLLHLDPEERRHLEDQGRGHREREGDDGVRSRRGLRLPGIGGNDDELLPEALRVLARELP